LGIRFTDCLNLDSQQAEGGKMGVKSEAVQLATALGIDRGILF
jgi:hypothetical protein